MNQCVISNQVPNIFVMELFQSVQTKIQYIGIEHPTIASNLLLTAKILFVISLMVGMILSSLTFILFHKKTFSEVAEAFFLLMTAILAITVYILFVQRRAIFYKLIDDARDIIQKRSKNPSSKKLYDNLTETIAKTSKWMSFSLAGVAVSVTTIPNAILSYWKYWEGFGNASFKLPLTGVYLYDQTLLGYSFGSSIQIMAMFSMMWLFSCILVFLSGFPSVVITFADDIQLELKNWSQSLNEKHSNDLKTKHSLYKILAFQAIIREYSKQISTAFQPVALAYLLWGIVCISITLVMLQISLNQNTLTTSDIAHTPQFIFWTFLAMYIPCHFGDALTCRQRDIGQEIYESSWHFLPLEQQMLLPLPMMLAQNPIYMKAFGSISCSRNIFKKITEKGFSYFMVLRQFEF